MKTAIPLLLCLAASVPAVCGGELREEFVHGNVNVEEEQAWPGHITFSSWLDEKQIVFWSSKGGLVGLSLERKMPVWTLKTPTRISNWSVSRKSQLIAYKASNKDFGESSIAVIDAQTGKPVFEADQNKLAKLLKQEHVIVSTLGLSPVSESLLLINYTRKFARSGFVFNPRNPDKFTTLQIDPSVRELRFSADGKRIVYIAAGTDSGVSEHQVLAVRNIDTDQDVFFQGKRILEARKSFIATIDAPFYSHIRHDGQNLLLYSQDNSWSKGRLFLRNLKTGEEKSFDGRNGHIELDVRFDLKRIALTGTSTDVTVLDFEGKVIAEKKKATADRNEWIEFSPAGDRLLVGSWDNTVRVFRIVE